MIEIGNQIPKVNGLDQLGETIQLADHKGKKTVIYFYPKDDTPGCTIEVGDFNRLKPEFEKNI